MELQLNTLGTCFFRAAFPRMEYEGNERTDRQATTQEGTPLWSVKVEATQDGSSVESVFVVVPCPRNPAEGLQLNEDVQFAGLRLISGNRRSGGRWERFEADKIIRKKRNKGGE